MFELSLMPTRGVKFLPSIRDAVRATHDRESEVLQTIFRDAYFTCEGTQTSNNSVR